MEEFNKFLSSDKFSLKKINEYLFCECSPNIHKPWSTDTSIVDSLSRRSNLKIIEKLLDLKANVNYRYNATTPLLQAWSFAHLLLEQSFCASDLLLNKKANPNTYFDSKSECQTWAHNNTGCCMSCVNTPLKMSLHMGTNLDLKLLLSMRADIDYVDPIYNINAIDFATKINSKKIPYMLKWKNYHIENDRYNIMWNSWLKSKNNFILLFHKFIIHYELITMISSYLIPTNEPLYPSFKSH